jgi:glycosyltransferase involved in cell wall biosynthesis
MHNKRILVLNYEFPPLGGGASPVSYEIAKGLVKRGHKVDVITMRYKDLSKYEVTDGINIHRVNCLRSKKEISYPWEQLTYIFSAIFFLRRHMKNNKYDINHTHFIIPTGIISLWLKKKYGLEYVITSHGSDVIGYNPRFKYIYPFLKGIWKKIIKESKAITTPSMFLQGEIKKIIKDTRFEIIPNGIDEKKFFPMRKENYILSVARLTENKGMQDLLDALKGIDLQGWKIKIVGEGPYRKELERKCKENNLEEYVEFLGWVENKSNSMRELYGKARIFVSSSWFENMSIVILEALSSGCCVIASEVGGNPELVGNENLFKVRDIDELKIRILECMNKELVIERIDNRFKWNKIIDKYEEVLL